MALRDYGTFHDSHGREYRLRDDTSREGDLLVCRDVDGSAAPDLRLDRREALWLRRLLGEALGLTGGGEE